LARQKDATTFSDPYLGLQFNHPASWIVRRKTKDMTRYTIPIAGSSEKADLQIFRAIFHNTKDVWQTLQLRSNETMKRKVDRQWEQVVINVPMLCTQLSFIDHGVPVTTLTGLYYTKTPMKMLVRLTAPTSDFDKVKYEFDQSLQSLQTTNQSTPEEDDPNVKFADTKPQLAPPKPDIVSVEAPSPPKLLKDLVGVKLIVSTKPVTLKVPHGWSSSVKDNEVTLGSSKLSGKLVVTVHYSLDSERPAAALVHASAPELDLYNVGVKREDTEPTPNLETCWISTVWRMGATAKGELYSYHASGEQGDFYFIAEYQTHSLKDYQADRKVIRALMDEIALTPGTP
jgi:hypothetical protein